MCVQSGMRFNGKVFSRDPLDGLLPHSALPAIERFLSKAFALLGCSAVQPRRVEPAPARQIVPLLDWFGSCAFDVAVFCFASPTP
jgi:hypothetical protein